MTVEKPFLLEPRRKDEESGKMIELDESNLEVRYLDKRFQQGGQCTKETMRIVDSNDEDEDGFIVTKSIKKFASQFLLDDGTTPWYMDAARKMELKQHELVRKLREVLMDEEDDAKNIFKNENMTICLSLSGGVDSIVHAALLGILQDEFAGRVCAFHIRHSNRSEQVHESQWVSLIASRVGIKVYSYVIELKRPHGELKTGLSRDRYEDITKDIRFRMYRRSMEMLAAAAEDEKLVGEDFHPHHPDGCWSGPTYNCVMLGHHQDDIDENRI